MNESLKNIIFDKLYEDLSHVEVISYKGSIWFIDREKMYWYLLLDMNNILGWRYGFFLGFFQLFSMEQNEFEPIIIEWVEKVINRNIDYSYEVGDYHKVESSRPILSFFLVKVNEILSRKVVRSFGVGNTFLQGHVEEVLNCDVNKTNPL